MTKKIKEIWKDVPGFEGLYQASNCGQVRSLINRHANGVSRPRKTPHILKQSLMPNGYMRLALRKNGKSFNYCVHRLVLITFSGKTGICCAHLDGKRANNNIKNLKWVTHKENTSHMLAHGTRLFGSDAPSAKLSSEEILGILKMKADGHKQTEIAKRYKITPCHVSHLVNGKSWAWFTKIEANKNE